MGKPCAQCGQPLTDGTRVCSCGFPVADAGASASAAAPTAAQTMVGFKSPLSPSAPPVSASPQKPVMQTMLGFAAPAELRAALATPSQSPSQSPSPMQTPSQSPTPAPAPTPQFAAKTMLGMASPLAGTPPPTQAQQPAPAVSRFGGTMLGVAMPGIAPAHSQPGVAPPQFSSTPAPPVYQEPLPSLVPAPAPFVRENAPLAPVRAKRSGVPLAVVAIVVAVLVLGAGVTILLISRGAPPMTATAKVAADGQEQLHLRCESCKDGTTATWQGAKGTFANKEVDLDLPAPLVIGDNAFQIAIDRPGVGRDETVKLVLPLAYRIRGDLDAIAATPALIKVDVEAQKGASVAVDGKPVALDASGKAVLPYDVTTDTTGPADEARTIERKIPYQVEDKDHKKSTGDVIVRVAVLPLHVDAPSVATLWTEDASTWIAGRTAKSAVVTANGKALSVAPDGSFEGQVDLVAGEQSITVRAAPADGAAKAAPRSVTVKVNRVAALGAEAKAFDATATVTFDALTNDASAIGQPAVVSGTVADVRVAHHHTVMLLDDKRGCAKAPCLVRVEYGAESTARAGEHASARGVVIKPITTPDGKTLPAIDASFVRVNTRDPR